MSEAPESLGGRLKAERERKGFTAQKAADQLHLDAWVIEALESGDYARMGPSVYGKGHLKRYAGLLGLPPDEILGAYEVRPPAPVEDAQAPSLRLLAAEAPRPAPRGTVAVGAAMATVLLIAAGILWWRPWQPRHAAATAAMGPAASGAIATPDGDPPKAPGEEQGAAGGGPVDARAVGAIAAADSGGAGVAADALAGAGHARLRLSFSADSWVDVHDASGRRLFAGRGRANSVKTITGLGPMKVYLGFASGVQLEVNNHVVAIGPQFVAGDVARFAAGADGVLRRDVRAASAGDPHP